MLWGIGLASIYFANIIGMFVFGVDALELGTPITLPFMEDIGFGRPWTEGTWPVLALAFLAGAVAAAAWRHARGVRWIGHAGTILAVLTVPVYLIGIAAFSRGV